MHGYVVVVADGEPNDHEQFLLKALMHQTAAAMSNAAMYHDALETTEHVRVISEERAAVNDRLQRTVAELERQERTHERLAEASASDGVFGLVEALRWPPRRSWRTSLKCPGPRRSRSWEIAKPAGPIAWPRSSVRRRPQPAPGSAAGSSPGQARPGTR